LNLGDRRLARRILGGDEKAFEDFLELYFPILFRFVLVRMNHHRQETEEVVQTALCAAVSNLKSYRGEASLNTWVCAICRHEIAAFYRRKGRQPRTVVLAEETPEVAAALDSLSALRDEGPGESLQRKETARLVQVTLDRMPGRYGCALRWKYLEGLSVREIAARLELSSKATESLLSRARESFRDAFSSLSRGRFGWPQQTGETP
jgi:RNA polymerase sigma-70 factor (ECF subfamily)